MISRWVSGVRAIYCHATSKDAAKADPAGEVRAEILAKAAAAAGVEHIVYNSSGMHLIFLSTYKFLSKNCKNCSIFSLSIGNCADPFSFWPHYMHSLQDFV